MNKRKKLSQIERVCRKPDGPVVFTLFSSQSFTYFSVQKVSPFTVLSHPVRKVGHLQRFSSPNKQRLLINAMALHWRSLGVFDLNGSLSNWHLQRICQFPSLPFSLPAFPQRPIKYSSGRGAHHRGMSQSEKGLLFVRAHCKTMVLGWMSKPDPNILEAAQMAIVVFSIYYS